MHARHRGDGEELAVPRPVRCSRLRLCGQAIHIQLRLQRRANGAGLAQFLQLALHGLAQRYQRIPVRCYVAGSAGNSYQVVSSTDFAALVLARQHLPDFLGRE